LLQVERKSLTAESFGHAGHRVIWRAGDRDQPETVSATGKSSLIPGNILPCCRMSGFRHFNIRCCMGDVLSFPRPVPKDGGKARILAARAHRKEAEQATPDSLVMLRADPEYTAPPCDCA
jgi:hypothetical protein